MSKEFHELSVEKANCKKWARLKGKCLTCFWDNKTENKCDIVNSSLCDFAFDGFSQLRER